MCGVLPYANNIVKALAEGAHDMRALAHHVGTAMHSRPCNTMPVIGGERNICALFVGMANEALKASNALSTSQPKFPIAGLGVTASTMKRKYAALPVSCCSGSLPIGWPWPGSLRNNVKF
jgi:hypothetical protein